MAEIDEEVDDLANSVVHQITGQVFPTQIIRWKELLVPQLAELGRWRFDWPIESKKPASEVVALLVLGSDSIQGMMALEKRPGFVFNLVEGAPHNVGQNKLYRGVAGNLFAYACARSFALDFEGFIAFDAKTELIAHFQAALDAERVGSSNRMIVNSKAAKVLLGRYKKESDRWPL